MDQRTDMRASQDGISTSPNFWPDPITGDSSSCEEKKDAVAVEHRELADVDSAFSAPNVPKGVDCNGIRSRIGRLEWCKTTFLRKGPLIGLFALLFTFLSIPASFLVLALSNGQKVSSWKLQPTVYLAILTALGNSAMRLAAIQGAMVVWWSHAMYGTTFAQLHRDWQMSLGALGAMTAGRHTNFIAIASLCATLVIIDGPLLQRASSVTSRIPNDPIELQTLLTPEIPSFFTGLTLVNDNNTPTAPPGSVVDFSRDFLSVFVNYTEGSKMTQAVSGCPGTCTATVQAAALTVSGCSTESSSIDYTAPLSTQDEAIYTDTMSAPFNRNAFHVVLYETLDEMGNERVVLETGSTDDAVTKSCIGEFVTNICQLTPAIAEYNITVSDDVITFAESPANPKVVQIANNTRITNETILQHDLRFEGQNFLKTTLGGIAAAGVVKFYSIVGLVPSPAPGDTPSATRSSAFTFQMTENYEAWDNEIDCAPAWKDPTQTILATLNELMFRTSIYTASAFNESYLHPLIDEGLNISATVQGTRIDPVNVFHVNYYYFLAAALVEFISVLLIFITFHGWWRLGRDVSFSPLEIARAFDAPLLTDVESNTNGNEIARKMGSKKVKYGVIDEEKGEACRKLGFGDAAKVAHASTF
ncbi:MAG: hypothetical protein M1820_008488 [Bogoriella megaspora]|nr:MAG: hypothetical protein M1820_008488 [Bogoriella megaspora]